MAIRYFCDRCGKQVAAAELHRGVAVTSGSTHWTNYGVDACKPCIAELEKSFSDWCPRARIPQALVPEDY